VQLLTVRAPPLWAPVVRAVVPPTVRELSTATLYTLQQVQLVVGQVVQDM